jgi:hypothetical protein
MPSRRHRSAGFKMLLFGLVVIPAASPIFWLEILLAKSLIFVLWLFAALKSKSFGLAMIRGQPFFAVKLATFRSGAS